MPATKGDPVLSARASWRTDYLNGIAHADDWVAGDSHHPVLTLGANPGLVLSTQELVLGTPSTLTVATTNAVTGANHTHAITASAAPGATESLLKSAPTTGLVTLAQLTTGVLNSTGANLGYVSTAPTEAQRIVNWYFPRVPNWNGIMLDYADEAFYWDKRYTSITVNPAQTGGTISDIFRDDANAIEWAAATSPYPITIEIDSSASPITLKSSSHYQVGLTLRSSATINYPTHIKIETWDTSAAAYVTEFDADVTITPGYASWLSPRFQPPGPPTWWEIYKLKITLSGTNPLADVLYLQRLMVYHDTAAWDPWHLSTGGGTVYGPTTVASTLAVTGTLGVTGVLTATGNITMPDGGTIGQAAGPLMTFDDSNNYLEITGAAVGIGTATPTSGKLQVEGNVADLLTLVRGADGVNIKLQGANAGDLARIRERWGPSAGLGTTLDFTLTAADTTVLRVGLDSTDGVPYVAIPGGGLRIGSLAMPTARAHLPAGSATASTAPLKFTSGTLLTTAEAGAIEFLTDDFFATITTGAARKAFVLDDGARLTATRVPFATTNGRLTDDADLTFATDTLSATKVAASGGVTTQAVDFTASTPDALAGDVNNWDLGNNTFIRASGGAADRIVTGIVARASGHLLIFQNIGTTNKITFANESASSTAGNRLINANAGSTEITPNHCVVYIYDATTARWREITHL